MACERIWDLRGHTELVPLTTVGLTSPATELTEGATFCGRTALGPLGFEDPMRVLVWRPPVGEDHGRVVVEKVGHVVGGRIEMTLAPAAGGSTVTWRQTVSLPWLPSWLRWLEVPVARAVAPGYRVVLGRLLGRRGPSDHTGPR